MERERLGPALEERMSWPRVMWKEEPAPWDCGPAIWRVPSPHLVAAVLAGMEKGPERVRLLVSVILRMVLPASFMGAAMVWFPRITLIIAGLEESPRVRAALLVAMTV